LTRCGARTLNARVSSASTMASWTALYVSSPRIDARNSSSTCRAFSTGHGPSGFECNPLHFAVSTVTTVPSRTSASPSAAAGALRLRRCATIVGTLDAHALDAPPVAVTASEFTNSHHYCLVQA
jgi:hypothetical protein